MARSTVIIVRFGRAQWKRLCTLLFSRYPDHEWATWVRFGWREAGDTLVFSMAELDPPRSGELDASVGHVAIQEPYSLRVALEAERHPFAIAVVHSHPRDCLPIASSIDDDMDGYYADYLQGFTSGRPYLSLIISEVDGETVASGRVWHQGRWHPVVRFVCEGYRIPTWAGRKRVQDRPLREERIERLAAGFGRRAAQRIRNACVAFVGASGTGSPAIEILARAGVGHLITVDPDVIESSNLERLHGAFAHHAADGTSKVAVAREHVAAINDQIEFEGFVGRVPQSEIVSALLRADVILGCTDQQHSRLALSEIAFRYLVPVIDCGVSLEGSDGVITGQTIQLVKFVTEGACALCRGLVSWDRVGQELMSESERRARQEAAEAARRRGEDPNGYWRAIPQLNTVGYLTTAAGALAAGAAIGMITQTFEPGFMRLQLNPLSEPVDAQDWVQEQRPTCLCARLLGHGDLSSAQRLITPPLHWPAVVSA